MQPIDEDATQGFFKRIQAAKTIDDVQKVRADIVGYHRRVDVSFLQLSMWMRVKEIQGELPTMRPWEPQRGASTKDALDKVVQARLDA
jgi:hypothetical protein